MKLLDSILTLAFAASADAQQKLYACTLSGDVAEVLDYATAPTISLITNQGGPSTASDIAVRPSTGNIVVLDNMFGIESFVELDPLTGQVVQFVGCFSSPGFSYSLENDHEGRLYGEDISSSGPLVVSANASSSCFTFGPQTGAPNHGDIAFDRDRTLLTLRAGTNELERVHPATGAAMILGDLGQPFTGLEIDVDGTVYGLASDGGLYRVTLAPVSVTFIGTLPTLPSSGIPRDWSGLAFRLPAGSVGESFCFCTGALSACGNEFPAGGCRNVSGRGAILTGSGTPGVVADDLVLTTSGMTPGTFGVTYMGTAQVAPVPLHNGTLCVLGAIYRFPPFPTGTGTASLGPGLSALSIFMNPAAGWIVPASTWQFQTWYRDLGGPCGGPSNHSNALRVTFSL
jgi:hypothetical protein